MAFVNTLSTDNTRKIAHIRNLLKHEVLRSFKLSDDDDVIKMLQYAQLSDNTEMVTLLHGFFLGLSESQRALLDDHNIQGTLTGDDANTPEQRSPQAQREPDTTMATPKKKPRYYRGVLIDD